MNNKPGTFSHSGNKGRSFRLDQAACRDGAIAGRSYIQARDRGSWRGDLCAAVSSRTQDRRPGPPTAHPAALYRPAGTIAGSGRRRHRGKRSRCHRSSRSDGRSQTEARFDRACFHGMDDAGNFDRADVFLSRAIFRRGKARKPKAAPTKTKKPPQSNSRSPNWRGWPMPRNFPTPRLWCCCKRCGCGDPSCFNGGGLRQ